VKTFPTLYKLTSTGAIQTWTIGVDKNVIITHFGQQDGKIQRGEETIKEGKNIGKANETSPAEQALAEATSKWEGKIKKGYVEDVSRAAKGEKDIDGGYDPMLAHKFADHGHKILYPAYVQPKLNGHRCTAVIKDGKCTLWSRTRKPITSCPHIVAELEKIFTRGHHRLDGELYNHAFKSNFEELASLIRQEVPAEDHTEIQYYLYDCVRDGETFAKRIEWLSTSLHLYEKAKALIIYLRLTETAIVKNEDEMTDAFERFLQRGYEGAMARNADGLYVGKRSYDLQKIKSFVDDEFKIVDIVEGRGGYAGCGIFVCETPSGQTFNVKMRGPKERLEAFFKDHSLWKNKELVVKYQNMSSYGVPVFPVGERFKDNL
jgi:DNA ligase 1